MTRNVLLSVLFGGLFLTAVFASAQRPASKQLVAHRGASVYAPEHTLEAYRLALAQKADFVEQDLAVTKDGVLVCLHDLTLERTTNVEEVFPDRFVEDKKGTAAVRRWFVHDFTLAEIKRLDAGSWFDTKFAGERIPTFQEAIDLVRGKAGLYPELKDPAFYRARGGQAGGAARRRGWRRTGWWARRATPVIVQSFDETTPQGARQGPARVPRVFLVDPLSAARLDSSAKVRDIAAWATGIGPAKQIVEKQPASW